MRTREKTKRRAVYSRPGVADVLADGMVVDISPSGLQIRTAVPLAEGDPIEIEVYPRSESPRNNIILVRGRVVRVSPEGGEYAMGVQLTGPAAGAGPVAGAGPAARVEFSAQARAMMARLPGRIQSRERGAPSLLAFAEHQAGEAETPVVFRKSRPMRRLWRSLLLLLLLLLLGGVGWWLSHAFRTPSPAQRVASYGLATRSAGETRTLSPVIEPEIREPVVRRAHADRRGAARLAAAQVLLLEGEVESARAAFRDLAEDGNHDALSRFVARLGMAWSSVILGNTDDAEKAVEAALARAATDRGGAIPKPWAGVAESMERDLERGDPSWPALGFLVDALVLGEMRAPADNPAPADEAGRMRIEVSTSQYLLTVRRGNLVLGRFPVGLGKDGATPEGHFSLVNKIRDPAWYNRGNVVPPGDPKNPLGAFWMGLGDDKGPTPIGIHPTGDSASIGENQSRGCIRMRPEDAERVFRWCPLGTPVRVAP